MSDGGGLNVALACNKMDLFRFFIFSCISGSVLELFVEDKSKKVK